LVPELPEVETMVRGIRPFMANRRILAVKECPTHCRPISISPVFKRFAKAMIGQTVTAVRRLGKRVVLDLSNLTSVVIEPRMTGLMLLANPPDVEHLRIEWQLEGTREYNSIWFWDRRGLGTIRLYQPDELERVYGPDALGPDALDFTSDHWRERLTRESETCTPAKFCTWRASIRAAVPKSSPSRRCNDSLKPRRRSWSWRSNMKGQPWATAHTATR
jgi:formamidopyrimidine-DNA glycosylase